MERYQKKKVQSHYLETNEIIDEETNQIEIDDLTNERDRKKILNKKLL